MDWDGLVIGPCMDAFGQPVDYTPAGGQTVRISGVFFDGFLSVEAGAQPGVTSTSPHLGVQVSQMPTGWDPLNAEGDAFVIVGSGKAYRVREGRPDGRGGARLDANLQ